MVKGAGSPPAGRASSARGPRVNAIKTHAYGFEITSRPSKRDTTRLSTPKDLVRSWKGKSGKSEGTRNSRRAERNNLKNHRPAGSPMVSALHRHQRRAETTQACRRGKRPEAPPRG